MNFGIPKKSLQVINNELAKLSGLKKAAVFGSRALGTYKSGSDIDLVLYGEELTEHRINQLRIILNEELPLAYCFDVVHYESIENSALKNHIEQFAKELII